MRNPNGFGTVVNLGKKRRRPYAVRITKGWTEDGKQQYKYISYHEKKTDAILALSEYNRNPYDLDVANITFEELYTKWYEAEFNNLATSTVNSYKSAYKYCEQIYKKPFKELKTIHLQQVINDIKLNSMKNLTRFLFIKIYKYAMELDIVEKDYSQYLKSIKNNASKEKTLFTNEEIAFLWENEKYIKSADIVLILLYTGMRIGELFDIKKENVHLEERYMIGGLKTQAGINRVIPIHEKIVPLIEKHLFHSTIEYLLMNNVDKQMKYPTFVKNEWIKIMNRLNANHTPHETRHTFITKMVEANVNELIIKKIVGHASSDVTHRYTHSTIEELVTAVNKIE